jgi:uncharacterized membrane protein YfcA
MLAILLLLAAGFCAGAMNAIAGGGSFLTFPALVFAGVPPTLANSSSTVALLPGGLASIWAYRRDVENVSAASLPMLMITSVIGGAVGAILLLVTSARAFDIVVPWILLLATLTFAFGGTIGARLRPIGGIGATSVLVVQFCLGIYGGYFGGAVGIMMMAAWRLLIGADVKQMTPVRILMNVMMNGAAVACFIAIGAVRWHETLIMLAATIPGGWTGARIERHMPAGLVRAVVIGTGAIITTLFFIRAG